MERYLIPLLSEQEILKEIEIDPLNVIFFLFSSSDLIQSCIKKEPSIIAYLKEQYITQELFDLACSTSIDALVKCTPLRLKEHASYEQIKALLTRCGNKIKDIPSDFVTKELCDIAFPTITNYKIILDTFLEEAYTKEVVDFIFDNLNDFSFGISEIPRKFLTKKRLLRVIANIESISGEQKRNIYFFELDKFPSKLFTDDVCERLLSINVDAFNYFPEDVKKEYAERVLPLYPLSIKSLVSSRTSDHKIESFLRVNPQSIRYLDFKRTREKWLFACDLDNTCYKYLPDEFKDMQATRKYCKTNFLNLVYAPLEYIDETFVLSSLESYLSQHQQNIDSEIMFNIRNVLRVLNENKILDLKNRDLNNVERKYGLRVLIDIYYDKNVDSFFANEIAYGIAETNLISRDEIKQLGNIVETIDNLTGSNHVGDSMLLQESLPSEIVLHEIEEIKLSQRDIRDSRFFYISDIHLDYKIESIFHQDQTEAIEKFIVSLADKIVEKCKLRWSDWLFIAGDIGSVYKYNEIFLRELSIKLLSGRKSNEYRNIAIVLGNHELWDFDEFSDQSEDSFSDPNKVLMKYQKLCEELRLYLLENDLLVIKNTHSYLIPNSFFDRINPERFKKYRRDIVAAIYGGIGFSGRAVLYNAGNSSIYRGVINYEEDVRRSKLFEDGLNKVTSLIGNTKLFILSHNPIDNWNDGKIINGATYINGHNHHNYYYVGDDYRIYADAQIGYRSLNVIPKYFSF